MHSNEIIFMSDEDVVLDTGTETEIVEVENHAGEPEPETPPETAEQKADRLERELAKRDKTLTKVQRRINQVTREMRDKERELANAVDQRKEPPALTREHFQNDDEYVDARARAIAREMREEEARAEAEHRQQQQIKVANEKRDSVISKAAAQSDDFDEDEFFSTVVISEMMAEAILDSDAGDKIVLHLNANPEEALRIANLSAPKQAIEINKLEESLAKPKAIKSNAPPPLNRVKGSGSSELVYRSDMSAAEYKKWNEAQHAKR